MNQCRHSSSSKIDRLGAFFLYPFSAAFAIGVVLLQIYRLVKNASANINNRIRFIEIAELLVCIFISCFLIYLAIQSFLFEIRKFMLDKEGLMVGYSKKSMQMISWNNVSEIAISAFQASASRQKYQSVICFFLYPKSDDFETKILNYTYGIRNRKYFVLIDYSDALLEKIQYLYPGKVHDYRNRQTT